MALQRLILKHAGTSPHLRGGTWQPLSRQQFLLFTSTALATLRQLSLLHQL